MKLERRFVDFECKASADTSQNGVFEGYGSVFGEVDSYGDRIMHGAFVRSLREHERNGTFPDMLWSHMVTEPIGEWQLMEEDERGLRTRGVLWLGQDGKPPDPYAVKSYRAMRRPKGKLGLSIGFVTQADKIVNGVREIYDVDLWEVSPVVFPANAAARVLTVKSWPGQLLSEREFEERLRRDAGMSRAEAKRAAAVYSRLLRDADGINQPEDIAGRHVEGQRDDDLVALLRAVVSGVPTHGSGSQGADRADR